MSYLTSNDRHKRKRDQTSVHQETKNEESSGVVNAAGEFGDESSSEMVSFLEFRIATIHRYSSLNWLGPGVMAVHWFKEYLKKAPFDWIQCPKGKPLSLPSSSSSNGERVGRKDAKRRKLANNSKGNFYFIPGQYLRNSNETNDRIALAREIAIQNVLDFGTPGVHYATSYTGVYNLLRKYGKFAAKAKSDTLKDIPSKYLHHAAEQQPLIVPVLYRGPPLHQ